MLLLLPPSEGKTAPANGVPVDLSSLSHVGLADARARVGNALAKVSGQRNAFDVLGVGPSLGDEIERNRTLWENPAAPAAQVYTGVLYEAAGMSTWDGATLERAADRIRIVSALWGAVSPTDRIPAYRLSMSTSLGRIGALPAFWRTHLADELSHLADGRLVVDCRSSSYLAAWRPSASPWLTVRVEREVDGRRSVVSHMAKHTRGLLAGRLAALETPPESTDELVDVARGLSEALDVTPGDNDLTIVIQG